MNLPGDKGRGVCYIEKLAPTSRAADYCKRWSVEMVHLQCLIKDAKQKNAMVQPSKFCFVRLANGTACLRLNTPNVDSIGKILLREKKIQIKKKSRLGESSTTRVWRVAYT